MILYPIYPDTSEFIVRFDDDRRFAWHYEPATPYPFVPCPFEHAKPDLKKPMAKKSKVTVTIEDIDV